MSNQEPIKEKVTYIGKVDYRGKELTFGIKDRDRPLHTYIIGKTGMGKSTLLENLAIQDITNGEGLCFIDPHGSVAEKLLDFIPESRIKDVVYFAPFDDKNPIGLNVLEKVEASKRHLVANGLMAAFKKLFQDQFSARMEYILNNIILALLENEGQTLLGVNRMLTDKEYRKFIVSNVTDPTVLDFWLNEYANYTDRFAAEAAPAIQNKVGQFVSNPLIRNIIGQQKTSFDIRQLMDDKKILIVNLSKGKVGEGNANLIGSLLVTKIYLAAMSRADVGAAELKKLPPFYFYVDEFQNFANESFASILSEARKYNLALTVAHQYIEQMTDEVKAAVFGNVGTMITFRVGATDAEIFEKEFAPYFTMDDIVNLSAYQIYLRLMIDGVGSKPFSAHTLNPIAQPLHSYTEAVIAYSRAAYSRPVVEVEEEIAQFYKPIAKEVKPTTNGDKTGAVREAQSAIAYPPRQYDDKKRYDDRRPPARSQAPLYNPNPQGRRPDSITHPARTETPQALPPVAAPPLISREETPSIPQRVQPHFGYKPTASLKDAISRASTEYSEEKEKQNGEVIAEKTEKGKSDVDAGRGKKTYPDHFDDKPASSLKEALERAMSEKGSQEEKKAEQKKEEIETKKETRKEVSEDVLRKLIEGE